MISLLPAFLQPAMSGSAKPKPGAASDSTCSANKLFVYGTLLSGYKPQGPADLVPPNTLQKARLLGGATVRGFEMRDIGQYPCIVTGAKESAVVGKYLSSAIPASGKFWTSTKASPMRSSSLTTIAARYVFRFFVLCKADLQSSAF